MAKPKRWRKRRPISRSACWLCKGEKLAGRPKHSLKKRMLEEA